MVLFSPITKYTDQVRVQFLRRLVIWLTAGLLCWILYDQIGNRVLMPIARQQLEQLAGTDVEIGSIDFRTNGRVKINDLLIGSQKKGSYDDTILKARDLEASFSFISLLKFNPQIKKIIVSDFVLNSCYDSDQVRWNLALVNIAGAAKNSVVPVIKIKKGTLNFTSLQKSKITNIASVPVFQGWITPVGGKDQYGFSLQTDNKQRAYRSGITGRWQAGACGEVELKGNVLMGQLPVLGNEWDIKDINLKLDYDKDNIDIDELKCRIGEDALIDISGEIKNYSANGDYKIDALLTDFLIAAKPTPNALVYSDGVMDKISPPLQAFLKRYKPQGVSDVDVQLTGKLKSISKGKLAGKITCKDISVVDKKFPYLLENMTGIIDVTESSADLKGLRCRHGNVQLRIDGYSRGFGAEKDCDISITSDNMALDDDVYEALNSKQKKLWWVFTPEGVAKIHQKISCSPGEKIKTELFVDLLGCRAVYQHFPYPLENITGQVQLDPEKFILKNVISISPDNDRMITLNGTVTDINSDKPRFNVIIDANSFPIDDTLKSALPAAQKKFYERFEVDAITNVKITVFPNEVGKRLVEYIADVSIAGASLTYEEFPLPLTNINLKAVLTPDVVIIKNMTGQSADGTLTIKGKVWPVNDNFPKPGLCMSIDARDIELAGDLLNALPENASNTLSALNPSGRVNILANIDLNSRDTNCPPYRITVNCLGNRACFEKFPYPVENLTGTITATEDSIKLEDITASTLPDLPDETEVGTLRLNAEIVRKANDITEATFSVDGSDIPLNENLTNAMPEDMRTFLKNISPTGKFDFNINNAKLSTGSEDKKMLEFIGMIRLKEFSFGGIGVLGTNTLLETDFAYLFNHGILKANSKINSEKLEIKGKALTELSVDIIYDKKKKTFRGINLVSDCYNGKIVGDFELQKSGESNLRYLLQLVFDEIDVQEMLAYKADHEDDSDRYTYAHASGSLDISGSLGDWGSNSGRLSIGVTDMKLAKQSLLGKIITSLQFNKPADFLFNNMTVEAYIKHEYLIFEQIYMSGQSTLLKGSGKLNLQTNVINLEFTAFGREMTSNPSFLESLAKGLGAAIAKVEVKGDMNNPEIKVTALPLIKSPLDILGEKN